MNSKRNVKTEWLGPVAGILESVYRCKSPASLYTEKARQLRREKGISGPPFDPYEYAKALGVEVEEREDMTIDGLLKQTSEGKFIVNLKKDAIEYRKRFTLAHELAHTFFYDILVGSVRFRGNRNDFDSEEERLCDIAASEMLMPFTIFQNDVQDTKQEDGTIPPTTIFSLSQRYKVSLQAVAIRISYVTMEHACAFWKPTAYSMNLEWITPQKLKNICVCQTGRSSIELASKQPGEIITSTDTFYGRGQKFRMVRKTSSVGLRSGQVLSVINLGKSLLERKS